MFEADPVAAVVVRFDRVHLAFRHDAGAVALGEVQVVHIQRVLGAVGAAAEAASTKPATGSLGPLPSEERIWSGDAFLAEVDGERNRAEVLLATDPAGGFACMSEGPLDMRFDPSGGGLTAADLVNTWDAEALADVLFRFGEERHSRRIARAIIAARPLSSTRQLADVVAGAQRGPREKIHPATRTFQALRIAVNDELGAVERVLPVAIDLLHPGGRLAVISFHSLEDRIVKQMFRLEATDCICPPRQPRRVSPTTWMESAPGSSCSGTCWARPCRHGSTRSPWPPRGMRS